MTLFSRFYPRRDSTTATVGYRMIVNPGIYNMVFDACCDTDFYESAQEARPSYDVVKNAARALLSAPITNAVIAPFCGEINVTWKAGGRRVKAIFGPEPDSFSVYREQMTNGRVTFKEMNDHAGASDLRDSIGWLSNTTLPCAIPQPRA